MENLPDSRNEVLQNQARTSIDVVRSPHGQISQSNTQEPSISVNPNKAQAFSQRRGRKRRDKNPKTVVKREERKQHKERAEKKNLFLSRLENDKWSVLPSKACGPASGGHELQPPAGAGWG